ncbi:hypothetical protein B0O99DRAFT_638138 [Bisporella sp. PMI_857]|nr:hypothetical protein B0O99DRAFT_638138 [Bisporella sp. PMI_857]
MLGSSSQALRHDLREVYRLSIGLSVTPLGSIATLQARLRDQWQQLVLHPLLKSRGNDFYASYVVVIDALDECDNKKNIQIILQLLSDARLSERVRLRVFLTSRPELPIPYRFNQISEVEYHDVVLHSIPRHNGLTWNVDRLHSNLDDYNVGEAMYENLTVLGANTDSGYASLSIEHDQEKYDGADDDNKRVLTDNQHLDIADDVKQKLASAFSNEIFRHLHSLPGGVGGKKTITRQLMVLLTEFSISLHHTAN